MNYDNALLWTHLSTRQQFFEGVCRHGSTKIKALHRVAANVLQKCARIHTRNTPAHGKNPTRNALNALAHKGILA